MKKRTLCLLMAVIMSIGMFTYAAAADATARTVSIFKVEGKDVKMTKGTEKEFAAKAGVKLFGGYTVSTGKDSYAYLKLDEDSLIKMDQKSKIKVNKQTSKKLSVSVLSGGLAVDAATQTDGKSMEIRAGNSALAIRGTYFVTEITPTGDVKFTMFEGSGVMSDGTVVPHGSMLIITENEDGTTSQRLVEITIDDDTSPFLLQNILDNADLLLDSGILTQDDLDKVKDLIDNMPEEPDAAELAGLGTTGSGQQYYSTESPRGGGEGGNRVTTTPAKIMLAIDNQPAVEKPSLKAAWEAISTLSTSSIATITFSPAGSNSVYAFTVADADCIDTQPFYCNVIITIESGVKFEVPTRAGGGLTIGSNVIVNNYGTFATGIRGSGIHVDEVGTLTISGGTFYNGGTGSGRGTFTNGGSVIVGSSGSFKNIYGDFYNSGDVGVYDGAFDNGSACLFDNNSGELSIDSSSLSSNYGFFNSGIVDNHGTSGNLGSIFITGSYGAFDNSGTLHNKAYGEVEVYDSGTFQNNNSVKNERFGVFSVLDPSFYGPGKFVQESGATFTNGGELIIDGKWEHNSSGVIGGYQNAHIEITTGGGITGNTLSFSNNFYLNGSTTSTTTTPPPDDVYYWNSSLGNSNEGGWQSQ